MGLRGRGRGSTGMAMGTRKQQATGRFVDRRPIWRSGGHPFYERLNSAEAGYDVEERSSTLRRWGGRSSGDLLPISRGWRSGGSPGERQIRWGAAVSADRTGGGAAGSLDDSRTRRLIDVETHRDVFTWVLESRERDLAGKTLMRRRWKRMRRCGALCAGERGELRGVSDAAGEGINRDADLARLDRKRKQKGSNREWVNPHDPEARITKMKDGPHLAHKAEHHLETGAVVVVTVQGADQGDTTTIKETFIEAAEQVEAAGEEPARRMKRGRRGDWIARAIIAGRCWKIGGRSGYGPTFPSRSEGGGSAASEASRRRWESAAHPGRAGQTTPAPAGRVPCACLRHNEEDGGASEHPEAAADSCGGVQPEPDPAPGNRSGDAARPARPPEPPVFLFLCRLDGSGKLLGIPSPPPGTFPSPMDRSTVTGVSTLAPSNGLLVGHAHSRTHQA